MRNDLLDLICEFASIVSEVRTSGCVSMGIENGTRRGGCGVYCGTARPRDPNYRVRCGRPRTDCWSGRHSLPTGCCGGNQESNVAVPCKRLDRNQRPTLAWQRGCGRTAAAWLRGEGQLGRHSISARKARPETGVAWRSPVLRADLCRQLGQRPKPRWGRRPRLEHPGDRIVWWCVSTDRMPGPPESPRATQACAVTYRWHQLDSIATEP